MRAALAAAARSHLLSDVPVGVFLSSGLDSSALAALAHDAASDSLRSFTVGLGGAANDESAVAQAARAWLHMRHQLVTLPEAEVALFCRRDRD